MNKLKDFLMQMPIADRIAFAKSCETTIKHMMNIAYGYRPCGEGLALLIQSRSGLKLRVEDLRPVFAKQLADAGYVIREAA